MSDIMEIEYDGFKAINVSNSYISLTTIPSLGGKIVSIENKKSGFDYAFKNPYVKNKIISYNSDFSLSSACGIDECFPTVAASKYLEPPWENIEIPDHGEIWSQEWETEIIGNVIIQKVNGIRFPYKFNRAISLKDNTITLNYRIENLCNMDFNYIWSIHPHFVLLNNTEIIADHGSDVYVDFSKKNKLKIKLGKYKWPVLKTEDGREVDFSKIPDIEDGHADKLYLGNMLTGEVKLYYPEQNESMTFSFDKNALKYCGIWIDRKGWPFTENPYQVLAIEPCSCISDRFEDSFHKGAFDIVKAKSHNEWNLKLTIQ